MAIAAASSSLSSSSSDCDGTAAGRTEADGTAAADDDNCHKNKNHADTTDDDKSHNADDDAVAIVRRLIGSKVHCRLQDNRTVTGRLVCVDRLSNVILADCVEERTVYARDYHPTDMDTANDAQNVVDNDHQRVVRRQLAQAMIPGRALVAITMDRNDYDKRITTTTSTNKKESASAATTTTTTTAANRGSS